MRLFQKILPALKDGRNMCAGRRQIMVFVQIRPYNLDGGSILLEIWSCLTVFEKLDLRYSIRSAKTEKRARFVFFQALFYFHDAYKI